jgi:hypothetical protein
MTAQQLIEKLQQLDPEMRIFVDGYEGGYNDPSISEIRNIALDVHTEWYYGTHEDAASELAVDKETVKGVVLL